MRELGIIMSAPSVLAMLGGTKTQTRRLIVPQPILVDGRTWEWPCRTVKPDVGPCTQSSQASWGFDVRPVHCMARFCRYKVGDLLYVKEVWRIVDWRDVMEIKVQYKADSEVSRWLKCPDEDMFERFWIQSTDDMYRAGFETNVFGYFDYEISDAPTRWRSSWFMPHWAARPELDRIVTEIRAERVQSISEEDAIAEGVEAHCGGYMDYELGSTIMHSVPAVYSYSTLWNSLHRTPRPVRANSRWATVLGWQKKDRENPWNRAWDWDRRNILGYVSFPWSEETRDPRETIRGKPHACFPNPWEFSISFEHLST